MSATATSRATARELAHRAADGVEVTLLWSRRTDRVLLVVRDTRTDEEFELIVPNHAALDAFNHPYAYASSLGVLFEAGSREPVYA
jgi:membrane-bound lytic murein transglycosylase B